MKVIGSMVLAALLSSCVTTGGFNTASEEHAQQDLVQLAGAYFEVGDMLAARRSVAKALEFNPRSAEAYNVLAMVQHHEGDVELARATYLRALELDSSNSRVRNNYAAFLFDAEEYEQAYRQLEIVAEDTNYEFRGLVFENLGLSALRTDRPQRAEAAFERALQIDSSLYRSALELAQIKFRNGEYAAARDYYRLSLSADDSRVDSLEYGYLNSQHEN